MPEIRNLCNNPSIEVNTNGWTWWQGVSSRITTTVTNLCPNPSYEVTTTGVGTSGATINRVFGPSPLGSNGWMLQGVFTTTGDWIMVNPAATVSQYNVYTASLYVKGTAGNRISIRKWVGAEAAITGMHGVLLTGGWHRFQFTFATTVGDTQATIMVRTSSPAAQTLLIDCVMIEQSAGASPYFDGTTPGGAWSGTPHNSTSYMVDTSRAKYGSAAWLSCPQTEAFTAGGPYFQTNTGPGLVAFTPGLPYTCSAWVKLGAGHTAKNMMIRFEWLNGAGANQGVSQANFTLQPGADWVRVSATGTCPATAIYGTPTVYYNGAQGYFGWYTDGMQVEQSATMSTYVHGDQLGGYWAGGAHASQSYAPLPEPPGVPYDLTAPIGGALRMLSYLPAIFKTFGMLRRVHGTQGTEVDALRNQTTLALAEAFVVTASSYGLAELEETLGLPPNPSLSVDGRRGRILGHLLSWRQPTPQNTKALANSFNNGSVTVDEMFDEYRVIVRLDSPTGVPENEADLYAAMLRYLPANLVVQFEHRYLLWGDVKLAASTWGELKATGWTWAELKTKAPGAMP